MSAIGAHLRLENGGEAVRQNCLKNANYWLSCYRLLLHLRGAGLRFSDSYFPTMQP